MGFAGSEFAEGFPRSHNPQVEAARDVVRSTVLRVLRDCDVDPENRQRIARRLLPELESRALRPFMRVLTQDD